MSICIYIYIILYYIILYYIILYYIILYRAEGRTAESLGIELGVDRFILQDLNMLGKIFFPNMFRGKNMFSPICLVLFRKGSENTTDCKSPESILRTVFAGLIT